MKMGSRGAGFCLTRGVIAEVRARRASKAKVKVRLNGQPGQAETTEAAIHHFAERPMEVRVDCQVQLPVSQGFGMSGAGALSALMALNDALGAPRPREDLVALAHRAEVECRTGLGDVYPQSLGGMDIREEAGGPPYGLVHRIPLESEVVLCVLGPPLSTREILSNEAVVKSINGVGRRCVDRFLLRRDLDTFFRLAYQFSRQTLLAGSEVQAAVLKASPYGRASMCMLGNSIFAMGDAGPLEEALMEHGDVYRASVDNLGARVL